MASKQLGKFRQWAGEKISSRDKTVAVGDDFKELEQDIELRKQGVVRLRAVSEDYHHVLSKKKESPSSGEADKLIPLEALGIVMVTHGEEYGDDSAFGTCLVALGRAHCKIAALQEAYGLTFKDTFISSCERFGQDIKDYEYQRKKLDSRRLGYEAAIAKLDKIKSCKKEKEKEKREAEDELQRCRLRFEETSEDVQSRIQTIQENEILQLRELSNFLDIHLNFAKQCYEVLSEVKAGWCDEVTLSKFEDMRINSHPQPFSVPDDDKHSSIRSKHSTVSTRASSAESVANSGIRMPVSQKSDTTLSRTTSLVSRQRSDSTVTSIANESTTKHSKKLSVTGWASSAVSSITGRGKKDRDTFTALMNEDDEKDNATTPSLSRSPSSKSTFSRKSPKPRLADLPIDSLRTNGRILKPPSQQEKKVVKAMQDFSGSSDELSFKAGDEITVINEVLDDWWLGMDKDGRKGLFPAIYTEPVSRIRRPSPFELEPIVDDNQPDDRDFTNPPLSASSLGFDTLSISSTVPEDEEERHLVPKPLEEDVNPTLPLEFASVPMGILWNRTNSDLPKRPPPPPPPRRSAVTTIAPIIPDRRLQAESLSSNSTKSGSDVSPFDSLVDTSYCTGFAQHPYPHKGLCKNCLKVH